MEKETIELVKKMIEDGNLSQEIAEKYCPELKESEDERIRKGLIEACKQSLIVGGFHKDKVISWLERQGEQKNFFDKIQVRDQVTRNEDGVLVNLSNLPTEGEFPYIDPAETLDGEIENIWDRLSCDNKFTATKSGFQEIIHHFANYLKKQKPVEPQQDMLSQEQYAKAIDECIFGEQKPADKVEPKFKVGDWVVCKNGSHRVFQVIERSWPDAKYLDEKGAGGFLNVFTLDKQYRLWTIQDAKDGDVLINWNNTVFIFKAIEDETVKFHIAYNEKWDAIKTPSTKLSHLGLPEPQFEFHPATKEQRDTLMKAMTDAGYTFDFEKKELKKIEQKPVENEEDEETFSYLEDVVDFCYRNQFVVDVQTCEKVRQLVFRLKLLCFQSKWSKNDITRIDEIIETLNIVQANRVRTQRMHYNKATIDKNIDWLKSLKDRIQPKQEWSEEDSKNLKECVIAISMSEGHTLEEKEQLEKWLKSLRPQKPLTNEEIEQAKKRIS